MIQNLYPLPVRNGPSTASGKKEQIGSQEIPRCNVYVCQSPQHAAGQCGIK